MEKRKARLIPKFEGMVINARITENGDIIQLENSYDHYNYVSERFPNEINPEKYVEDKGWIKISGGRVIMNTVNQRQIDALFGKIDKEEYEYLILCFETEQGMMD